MKGYSTSFGARIGARLARPVPVAADASRVGPVVSVVLAGLFAWSGPCAAAPPAEGLPCLYGITVVPPLPLGSSPKVEFYDINDAGVAVGWATWDLSGAPCIWSAETGVQLLPMPPGASGASARRINNNGWILVSGTVAGENRGFIYIPYQGSYGILPMTPMHPDGEVSLRGINDHNEVVGSIQYIAEGETVLRWGGLRWTPKTGQELFLVPGWGATTCIDINDDGFIAGSVGPGTSAGPGSNGVRAFLYDGTSFTIVEPWDSWTRTYGAAITDSGILAGGVWQPPVNGQANKYTGFVMHPGESEIVTIVPPPPWQRFSLQSINDAGIACGDVITSNGTPAGPAVAGTDGTSMLLKDLVAPGQLVGLHARRIANDGMVLGHSNGNALLFTPQPSGGDLDCDAMVGPADLGLLLGRWALPIRRRTSTATARSTAQTSGFC